MTEPFDRHRPACRAVILLVIAAYAADAADIAVTRPLDLQVVQRTPTGGGQVPLQGVFDDAPPDGTVIETRVGGGDAAAPWGQAKVRIDGRSFSGIMTMPAGGWHRLEVRATLEGRQIAANAVERVGVGEVFVVAGQSNSANHGEARLRPTSGRVVAFDGTTWRTADDPQPGATGEMGSFMPALGDLLVESLGVPIGFVACGVGATSVRQWLPEGTQFPNPPTIESHVRRLPNGAWESTGGLFRHFVDRMEPLGPHGFRAVLWHQGESDANQRDAGRTLAGPAYRECLATLITASRREIGWDAPWLVAQVSYHVPGDEFSPDIREAQASICRDGLAIAGPDSDALKGDLREGGGRGVHFSEKGLRELAARWAEKILPWIDPSRKQR